MHLNWILIAMPLASLLYLGWVVTWQKPTAYRVSHAISSLPSNTMRRSFPQSRRIIRWILSREFEAITCKFQDIIFIDLLPKSSDRPLPFHGFNLLYVEPDEMCDVLRWSPPSSCVVLYGPSILCKSMLRKAREIAGRAPVFVLTVKR